MNPDSGKPFGGAAALSNRLGEPAVISAINMVMVVISLAVGSAFILVGGWFIHRHHLDEFIFGRATAQGRVIENHPSGQVSGVPTYFAIVYFKAQDGRDVTIDDWIGLSPPSFRVGQSVTLFYDPEDPQHAMIDRGWKNYLLPGIPGGMGFLMILGGIQRWLRARTLSSGNRRSPDDPGGDQCAA
jgi:Protein of unknown function (DUF3592)